MPLATYRLQLHAKFPFAAGAAVADYLADLGISHCYTAPILQSRRDSMHGYDVCDHSRMNSQLGGSEGFESFSAALRRHQLGLVLDVVPNHMGVGDLANRWWTDVLENGPASRYARYFDIDWHPVNPSLDSKVLLPVLGGLYGPVLERGEIRLAYDQGRFWLRYFELSLPVAPQSTSGVLEQCAGDLAGLLGEENENILELRSLITALKYLPSRAELNPDEMAERYREKESIRRHLARLVNGSAEVQSALDRSISAHNGTPGDPRSFDRLDALIGAQSYRPSFWRVATEEINYRRFFDINDLAAIRIEVDEVFHETHALIFRLLREGKAGGLRIDHPDGLRNPTEYFRQLQRVHFLDQLRSRLSVPMPNEILERQFDRLWRIAIARQPSNTHWPLFVVVEKILSEAEPLPLDWAAAGTTGYDFLVSVNRLFVDSTNEKEFDRIYREWAGQRQDFGEIVYRAKQRIMQHAMASELNSLAHRLDRITERNRHYRDFTLNTLRLAIRETIAALSVYRTYITDPDHVSDRDRRFIEDAIAEARGRNPALPDEVFDFFRDLLLLRNLTEFAEPDRESVLNWLLRFQQLTGPIMAKGVEDTTFYIYNRFVSLNEVGGHPDHFGLSVEAFHTQQMERQRDWPDSMLSSSTHDTKRSEDVRARLNVLSELPGEWEAALKRWREWNADAVTKINRIAAPSTNDQYLFYQTLIGIWPPEPLAAADYTRLRPRMTEYMLKAAKEAKVQTSWVNPNAEYETALTRFVERLLPDHGNTPFLEDVRIFQRRIAHFGYLNSLAQLTLKLTCPGVPDIYQGCELWDFHLVDPDNRHPVDFDLRQKYLTEMRQRIEKSGNDLSPLAAELIASRTDGRIKLYVMHRLLTLRRDTPQLFLRGEYRPLIAESQDPDAIVAFARRSENAEIVVAVPCRVVRILKEAEGLPLGEIWSEERLNLPDATSGTKYRNLFTGEVVEIEKADGKATLPLAAAFREFPIAVLVRE